MVKTIERRPLGWTPQLWVRSLGRPLLKAHANGIDPSKVTNEFLDKYLSSLVADNETLRQLLFRSIGDWLRPTIREFDPNHNEQLTWPEWVKTFPKDEREIAEQFNSRRHWDPLKDQHCRPQDMGPAALRRAAEFLEQHGQGEIREARICLDLAAYREEKGWNDDDDEVE